MADHPDPSVAEIVAERDLFHGAFEASHSPIVLGDLEGRILDCNRAAWVNLGLCDKGPLIGRRADELVADPSGFCARLLQIVQGGPSSTFECVVRLPGGPERTTDLSLALRRDAAGRPVGVVAVLNDVLERERKSEALRHVNAIAVGLAAAPVGTDLFELFCVKLRDILCARAVIVSSLDAAASELIVKHLAVAEGVLEEAQKSVGRSLVGTRLPVDEALCRQSGAEVEGPSAAGNLGFGVVAGAAAQVLEKVAGTGDSFRLLLRHGGESVGTALVAFGPGQAAPSKELLHVLANLGAVSLSRARAEQERRKLEEQVLQRQKLESLGVLAGGVAHGFNDLLVGVLARAGLCAAELPKDSLAREHLRQIELAARTARDLTRQLLTYTGRELGRRERVNLSALVEEMARLLEISISKKRLLKCRFAKGLPAVVADPAQVRQLVLHLVGNATDAEGDNPGVIAIGTGTRHCDRAFLASLPGGEELPAGDYVWVEVEDTGAGMTPEVVARVFEPFYSTKLPGRGLGLPAVLGIARAHRGAVQVESEVGTGSVFRVLLPVDPGTVAPALKAPETSLWRGSGVVLVADDEPIVRSAARGILVRMGFEVLLACDGDEAVQTFRAHADRIALVLLDVQMPNKTGPEALREIRALKPAVKAILSSGYSLDEVASAACDAFAQKPYGVDELADLVRQVMEG
ncbi:MAG: response regulator [Deltaproteobacteria bacterium]|nr:response regulator [Deltaproteobacteria bacterium]